MFKFAATLLLLWPFIALSTVLAIDGVFVTPDGRLDLATVLEAVLFQSALIFVLLRVVWWSSRRAYDLLYWPTAIAASAVVLRGIVFAMSTAWLGQSGDIGLFILVGGLIVLIGFLMAYTLWRTKQPRQTSS